MKKIKKETNDDSKSLKLNMSTINELDNEIARQEVKNGNTHYIGDNIDDFNKWADNLLKIDNSKHI